MGNFIIVGFLIIPSDELIFLERWLNHHPAGDV